MAASTLGMPSCRKEKFCGPGFLKHSEGCKNETSWKAQNSRSKKKTQFRLLHAFYSATDLKCCSPFEQTSACQQRQRRNCSHVRISKSFGGIKAFCKFFFGSKGCGENNQSIQFVTKQSYNAPSRQVDCTSPKTQALQMQRSIRSRSLYGLLFSDLPTLLVQLADSASSNLTDSSIGAWT